MNCPACRATNRAGARSCKRCSEALPPNCAACGSPVSDGVELCVNCRTERVPAAMGVDLEDDDGELLDESELVEEPPRYPFTPRFVGRKVPLARLLGLVDEVATRSEVGFVAVTGPAGVGKTRLADELQEQLRTLHPNYRVLRAVCGGPGAPPFAAFERLLRQRFAITAATPAGEGRARITAGVTELIPAPRGTEIAHLIAHLAGLTSIDSPLIERLADTPAQLEARTFIALRRFLAADAIRAPIVLILDDAERAAPETVNLVHYLSAGLNSAAVMLLCVARPSLFETHSSFGDGDAPLTRVELGPLDDDEAAELFAELCRPAGEPPADPCVTRASGSRAFRARSPSWCAICSRSTPSCSRARRGASIPIGCSTRPRRCPTIWPAWSSSVCA